MPLNTALTSAQYLLELDGKVVGRAAGAEVGAIKVAAAPVATSSPRRTIANLQYGDCTVVMNLSDVQPQLEWLAGLWRKSLLERDGAIILADMNFKERRRAAFAGAVVTQIALDDLNAAENKSPYQVTYSFAPSQLKYSSGAGTTLNVLPGKQKAISPANFRITLGNLPCQRVIRVSGLSLRAELASDAGTVRLPSRTLLGVTCGDLTVEVSGDDATFAEWNKFATTTLQDGVVTDNEELTCSIEWLDPTLKNVLATLSLTGCALKEFKFGPKLGQAESASCTAVFSVEQFGSDGLVFKP